MKMIYQMSPKNNSESHWKVFQVLLCILSKAVFRRQEGTVIDLAVLSYTGAVRV